VQAQAGPDLLQLADAALSAAPTLSPQELAEAAAAAAGGTGNFEAQFSPMTAVAAACAAVPPILFWARIALAEQRRRKEAADKEAARKASWGCRRFVAPANSSLMEFTVARRSGSGSCLVTEHTESWLQHATN
jgi:hypothetical protein